MSRFAKRLRFPALALGLALAAGLLFACAGGDAGTEAPATQQPTEEAAATSPPSPQPTGAAATSPPTQQPTEEAAATSPPSPQPTEAAATSPPTQQPTEEAATPSPATQQPTEEAATAPPTEPQPEVGHETGQRAPNFMLTTSDGEQLTLASFQGRPVLLYFFATW